MAEEHGDQACQEDNEEDDESEKLYLNKDFAMIYTDLAMTYQGIDELDFALEYLSKSI